KQQQKSHECAPSWLPASGSAPAHRRPQPSGIKITEGKLIYQIIEGEPTRGFLLNAMLLMDGSHLAFIFLPLLCHERAGLGTPCSMVLAIATVLARRHQCGGYGR